MEVLNIGHDRWQEFITELSILIGPPEQSKCQTNFDMTKQVLDNMGFDVESTLKYLQEHGGGCDCEVLMNVNVVEK